MDHAKPRFVFPPATMEFAAEVAHSSHPVLIDGKTGTGKTLLAEVIHSLGPRRNRPIVTQGCGGMDAGTAGSIIFGHERGAYTDAVRSVAGVFERAERSDLVLNDLDGLSLESQSKLLHFFDYGEITRLGSEKVIRPNTRVIVTTNKSPEHLVAHGQLREDLYFRLASHRHTMPSLEERDDIGDLAKVMLCSLFQDEFKGRFGSCPELTKSAVGVLESQQNWPGNCRTLKAVLLGCFPRAKAGSIDADLVRSVIDQKIRTMFLSKQARPANEEGLGENAKRYHMTGTQASEKKRLEAALGESGGIVRKAAKMLGMGRATLNMRITRYQIDVQRFRNAANEEARAASDSGEIPFRCVSIRSDKKRT